MEGCLRLQRCSRMLGLHKSGSGRLLEGAGLTQALKHSSTQAPRIRMRCPETLSIGSRSIELMSEWNNSRMSNANRVVAIVMLNNGSVLKSRCRGRSFQRSSARSPLQTSRTSCRAPQRHADKRIPLSHIRSIFTLTHTPHSATDH